MPGWRNSVGSGPLMWMLSNATSTAWLNQHQRKGRLCESRLTDERPLVGPPGRARPALPRGGVIQSVQVRRARESHARAPARRMARPRRARGDWRGPVVRPGCDPARCRRARAGNPGPRRAVRALFAETGRYQPAGLERRDGAAGGLRGLRALRAQAAGLTPLSEKKMTDREQYTPGPASGAQLRKKDGQLCTLVLVRDLRHSPEKVWQAITGPAHLREWAPFDADGSLGRVGG